MKFRQQRRWIRSFTYINYLQFPFLINRKTVSYLNKNKTIFVLNAFNFVGISYISHSIRHIYGNNTKIYWEAYNCEESEILRCHDSFENSLNERIRHIVVQRSILDASSILYYKEKAKDFNYLLIFVQPKIPYREDLLSLQIKTKIGCFNEELAWRAVHPEFYAFFVNEGTSKIIMQKSRIYFDKCLEYFPAIKKRCIAMTGSTSFDNIYNMDYNKLLHCTTKYIHKHTSYQPAPIVSQSVGKYFVIHLKGFFFTDRTAGAIIKLKTNTLKLYQQNDTFSYKTDTKGDSYPTFAPPLDEINSECFCIVNTYSNTKLESDIDKQVIPQTLQTQAVISMRKGTRAHLTLGCANGVSAVQTGFDLMHLKYKALEKYNGIISDVGGSSNIEEGREDDEKVENKLDQMVIDEGALIMCYDEKECEVMLDWSVPIHCIFNASY